MIARKDFMANTNNTTKNGAATSVADRYGNGILYATEVAAPGNEG